MNLKDLTMNKGTVLADGAMGTYFSLLTGKETFLCEISNIDSPDVIEKIHKQYIDAGAKLIRTNSFMANTKALNVNIDIVCDIVKKSYEIALRAVGDKKDVVIACDISSIYSDDCEEAFAEYKAIIDTFYSSGGRVFIFETLPSLAHIEQAVEYIKKLDSTAEIILSFTVSPDGQTREGISLNDILEQVKRIENNVDAIGLNCGCGPTHILKLAQYIYNYSRQYMNKPVFVMPNAGYPSIENARTVFNMSPKYFADAAKQIVDIGISVIGGCCGTQPEHIQILSGLLNNTQAKSIKLLNYKEDFTKKRGAFTSRIAHDEFVIAVELDPPYGSDITKLINGAKHLKTKGVDIITISDSPLARTKLDSVICSSKIKREVDIDVLPHMCCRDKNINALRSSILGAHCEGVRSILFVTGDHISESDRGIVKPVFNVSSTKLTEVLAQMNSDIFLDEPILAGCALNPNVTNKSAELVRIKKKLEAGAGFFLTQPIFDIANIDIIDEARKMGAKVLVGIMPLVSFRNANYMNNEVPGITIPQEYISRFTANMDKALAEEIGIDIAVEISEKVKSHADGFYFVAPFNRAEMIGKIIDKLREKHIL